MNFQSFFDNLNPEATLTHAQRRYMSVVFDGADPNPLDALDVKLFGAAPIPQEARAVTALLKGARIGGTWFHSLHLLYRALTAELSTLARGEIGYCIIVGPELRMARHALSYILGACDHPSIAKNVVASTSDSVTLKRKDGRKVTIECLPASRGGSATRGRSVVGALMDEASFFYDASNVVNDSEVFRSITARIVPGGNVAVVSTAFAQIGLLQSLIEANKNLRTTALAVTATTLTMRDDPTIRQLVTREESRDPLNARREYFCEALPAGSGGLFDVAQLKLSLHDTEAIRKTDASEKTNIQIGADLALVKDSSAFVAVHQNSKTGVCTVLDFVELKPGKDGPLAMQYVLTELDLFCKRYGQTRVYLDHHSLPQAKEMCRLFRLELQLSAVDQSAAKRDGRFGFVVEMFRQGKVKIPKALSQLTDELSRFMQSPKNGGGHTISIPRTAGSHGDVASAFILAMAPQASNDLARRANNNMGMLVDVLRRVESGEAGVWGQESWGGYSQSSFEHGDPFSGLSVTHHTPDRREG